MLFTYVLSGLGEKWDMIVVKRVCKIVSNIAGEGVSVAFHVGNTGDAVGWLGGDPWVSLMYCTTVEIEY